jgi:hypothetical protein
MAPRQIKEFKMGCELSFRLGQYTTVFRAEVYAIKACTVENQDRNSKDRFYQTVKLQLKYLVNIRSSQNWSRAATNPSYN